MIKMVFVGILMITVIASASIARFSKKTQEINRK
jgi:hypothetical protein